ncbi:MAG: preprotein translocase subunit SecA [Mycoplasmataceae bacterium]|nr:preprotein translocase subunit SecA [Mycoplasmataceae bacterium]
MANLTGMRRFNIFAPYRKLLRKAKRVANDVDALKKHYRALTNEQLANKTNEFLNKLNSGQSLNSLLIEIFATVREAIYRVTGLFAFKVQIIGAYILHGGDFAELYTGEGKTLVCVMVAYANALMKHGVHVITVNEYLVQRDAKFCAECLNPLGITVGYNLSSFNPEQKREMFNCDITYTTNSELGFDYLRDNMVHNYQDKVIRELYFAIVDEGDSVLIDEARTPLIISGMPKRDVSKYVDADKFVKTLKPTDYKIDAESNSINLLSSGIKKAEDFFKLKNYFLIENSDLVHKIRNALLANYVFAVGKEYIVRDDKILLVDQFTGRILEGRSYNAGLQQAIQAKEYVKIEPENIVVATITYQSFFRLYKKLAACSGTALSEDEEFMKIYNMVVVPVPTNKPVLRKDNDDYIFSDKVGKWHHVTAEIEKIHSTGQPVLVGTASVEDSEQLCTYLRNKGINFNLLNAKNNATEAEIIMNGGQIGAITISTNMAGRGTDIKLGKGVKELGGLYVIGTEHSESRRVDNQLRGRSGRQGDVGMTRFFVSLEDELFRRFAWEKIGKLRANLEGDKAYHSWFFTKIILGAQKKVESANFDIRKNLIDYDTVLSNQRELIYKQRDQILFGKDNIAIITKMCENTAKEIIKINVDQQNNIYVESEKVANILNNIIFNSNVINPNFFTEKPLAQCEAIVSEIIKLSVNARIDALGDEQSARVLKQILVQNLDFQWTNHIDLMFKVREGVQLRSYEQKSPLNIYIQESDDHFNVMKQNIARNVIASLHRIYVPNADKKIKEMLLKTIPQCLNESVIDDLQKPAIQAALNNDNIEIKNLSISSTPIVEKTANEQEKNEK